jgi:hypothetical protein
VRMVTSTIAAGGRKRNGLDMCGQTENARAFLQERPTKWVAPLPPTSPPRSFGWSYQPPKFFFIPNYGGWQIETFGPTMGVIGYFARRPESNQLPQLSPSYMAQLAAASLMTAVLASIALEAFRASRGFA